MGIEDLTMKDLEPKKKRGRPKKILPIETGGLEASISHGTKPREEELIADATPQQEKKETKEVEKPPRVLPDCGEHEKLFEAPDGAILIGAKNSERLWYRKGNMFINPMRKSEPRP